METTRTYVAFESTVSNIAEKTAKVERSVPTGDEYDGVMYRFTFEGGWTCEQAETWMKSQNFYPKGKGCTARGFSDAGLGDSLCFSTPAYCYSRGSVLIYTQMMYPAC